MARIWNLRLNLDEFNSSLAGLDSDAERLAFLSGFNAGLNGRFKKDIAGPWESGWKVGNTSHVEAIKFSEKQRAKALLRDYHGHATASPRHDSGNATAMPNDNRQSKNRRIHERCAHVTSTTSQLQQTRPHRQPTPTAGHTSAPSRGQRPWSRLDARSAPRIGQRGKPWWHHTDTIGLRM